MIIPNEEEKCLIFKHLTTALSATVGLGNIAGVAIAITIGGPGATFWMIIAGLLGMASKFTEVTLGVKYRNIDENGQVSGGPMFYLSKAFKKRKHGKVWKSFGRHFCCFCYRWFTWWWKYVSSKSSLFPIIQ